MREINETPEVPTAQCCLMPGEADIGNINPTPGRMVNGQLRACKEDILQNFCGQNASWNRSIQSSKLVDTA